MIKPEYLDYSSPAAVLLSHDAARFAGYDLQAAGAQVTTIEDNEVYSIVQVELETVEGSPILRKLKAFKNAETVEELPTLLTLSPTPTEITGSYLTITLGFNLAGYVASDVTVQTNNASVTGTYEGNNQVMLNIDIGTIEDLSEFTVTITADTLTANFTTIYEANPPGQPA